MIGKGESGEAFVGSLVQSDGTFLGTPVPHPRPAATVDEVCFAVPRSVWQGQPLDERFDLHYYAVDYCLQVAEQGLKAYVVPALLQHQSRTLAGDIASPTFRECQRLLLEKWRRSVNATTGFLPYPDLLEDVEALSPEEADLPLTPAYAQAFRPRRDTLSAVQLRANNWSATAATIRTEVRRGHPAGEVLAAASAGAPPQQGSLATFLFEPPLRVGALAEGEWLWILVHGGHSDRTRCVVHQAPHDPHIGPALVAGSRQAWTNVQIKGGQQVLAFRTCY
ncbi:MAG: hypothetical protein FJX74_06670 [Armatimonadetes bacterium]|nr:hypothetical protein [Armatimonadota bacterium]